LSNTENIKLRKWKKEGMFLFLDFFLFFEIVPACEEEGLKRNEAVPLLRNISSEAEMTVGYYLDAATLLEEEEVALVII
jgi:hypothetical protein